MRVSKVYVFYDLFCVLCSALPSLPPSLPLLHVTRWSSGITCNTVDCSCPFLPNPQKKAVDTDSPFLLPLPPIGALSLSLQSVCVCVCVHASSCVDAGSNLTLAPMLIFCLVYVIVSLLLAFAVSGGGGRRCLETMGQRVGGAAAVRGSFCVVSSIFFYCPPPPPCRGGALCCTAVAYIVMSLSLPPSAFSRGTVCVCGCVCVCVDVDVDVDVSRLARSYALGMV